MRTVNKLDELEKKIDKINHDVTVVSTQMNIIKWLIGFIVSTFAVIIPIVIGAII